MKWNESGFRPPLCTYRLNWARRTSWGWWDDWDDTVLQTQDSKFKPWRSEAEHATSRSRKLPTILTFTRGWGRNNFVSFKPPRPGTEPRTLAWKAAVLTTTLGPPPRRLENPKNFVGHGERNHERGERLVETLGMFEGDFWNFTNLAWKQHWASVLLFSVAEVLNKLTVRGLRLPLPPPPPLKTRNLSPAYVSFTLGHWLRSWQCDLCLPPMLSRNGKMTYDERWQDRTREGERWRRKRNR